MPLIRCPRGKKERFFAKAQNDKVMQGLGMTEVNVILNAVKDLKKKDSSPRLRMTKQCKTSE